MYSTNNFPDKAIDILDQAGSKVKIKNIERPQAAKDIEQRLEDLALKESSLSSEIRLSLLDSGRRTIRFARKVRQDYNQWAKKTMKYKISVKKKDIYEVVPSRTGVPISDISKKDS